MEAVIRAPVTLIHQTFQGGETRQLATVEQAKGVRLSPIALVSFLNEPSNNHYLKGGLFSPGIVAFS
jgi:hypothetical protein